ncbi:MAG: hypothetical protein OXC40_01360 [Proteobacteria bacterium]|nr:hypothetical protein [Pseudomonadota bacterium]
MYSILRFLGLYKFILSPQPFFSMVFSLICVSLLVLLSSGTAIANENNEELSVFMPCFSIEKCDSLVANTLGTEYPIQDTLMITNQDLASLDRDVMMAGGLVTLPLTGLVNSAFNSRGSLPLNILPKKVLWVVNSLLTVTGALFVWSLSQEEWLPLNDATLASSQVSEGAHEHEEDRSMLTGESLIPQQQEMGSPQKDPMVPAIVLDDPELFSATSEFSQKDKLSKVLTNNDLYLATAISLAYDTFKQLEVLLQSQALKRNRAPGVVKVEVSKNQEQAALLLNSPYTWRLLTGLKEVTQLAKDYGLLQVYDNKPLWTKYIDLYNQSTSKQKLALAIFYELDAAHPQETSIGRLYAAAHKTRQTMADIKALYFPDLASSSEQSQASAVPGQPKMWSMTMTDVHKKELALIGRIHRNILSRAEMQEKVAVRENQFSVRFTDPSTLNVGRDVASKVVFIDGVEPDSRQQSSEAKKPGPSPNQVKLEYVLHVFFSTYRSVAGMEAMARDLQLPKSSDTEY